MSTAGSKSTSPVGARRGRRVTRRQQGATGLAGDERHRRGGWWWLLPLLLLLALIGVGIAALVGAFTGSKHHALGVTPALVPAKAKTAPPGSATTVPAPTAVTPAAVTPSTSTAPTAATTATTATPAPAAGGGVAGAALVGGGAVPPRAATGTLAAAGTVGDVLFAENSTTVDSDGKAVIARAAANIHADKATAVNVIGYTDSNGNAADNAQLSLARARTVQAALQAAVGGGVTVTSRAEGQADAVASNSTPAGQLLNRRVAITTATGTTIPAGAAPAGSADTPKPGSALVGGGGVAPTTATGKLATAGTAGDVLFAENSANLDSNAQMVVARAAATIRSDHTTAVTVTGNADSNGTASANTQLSLQRADTVITALRALLPGTSVTFTARADGQTQPVASNATPAGQQLNRRVVITAT